MFHQAGYAYRFDWGMDGLRSLAPHADVVIIVDVLRFSSAVNAALETGSVVYPYPWNDEGVAEFAAARDAVVAGLREHGHPSLSPTDLLGEHPSIRLVLPSPNGSALSFAARDLGAKRVLAGSLRNAGATAQFARRAIERDGVVAVIAAGEVWRSEKPSLRPAVEDLLGAGAILAALDPSGAVAPPRCSPEAFAARAAFLAARPLLRETIRAAASGAELLALGWEDDVANCSALDVSVVVAELVDDRYERVSG